MEKKILLLLAWLMLAVTGCSANDPQTDSPDTPPVEKPEEPAEPSGNRKILIVYFPTRATHGRLPVIFMIR